MHYFHIYDTLPRLILLPKSSILYTASHSIGDSSQPLLFETLNSDNMLSTFAYLVLETIGNKKGTMKTARLSQQ